MNKRLTRLTRFVTIDPAQTYGRREELRQLARRSHQVVAWAAVTGVITGLFVAALDRIIVDGLVSRVLTLSPWIAAPLPGVGLLIALGIRSLGRPGVSPATADEYLHAFHDPAHQLALRDLAIRSGAAIAGLGAGLPMGLEGPSLYAGATIGSAVQRRLPRVFRGAEHRVLMVAGAAAGVAAIFKTPATGAVFALEVPYRDDLARRMLLPALVASACGYLTFVSINGTAALIPVGGNPAFTIVDLLGAVALGIIAGIGARAFAWMLRHAKTVAAAPRPLLTTIASGVGLAAVFGLGRALTGESLILGSGYQVIKWATIPGHSLWILGVMFLLRSFATALAVAGGRNRRALHSARCVRCALWIDHRKCGESPRSQSVHAHRGSCFPRRWLPSAAGVGHVRR